MLENNMLKNQNVYQDETKLRKRLALDLKNKIDSFSNTSAALAAIERNTGISKRQISRYLSQKSSPQFLNLKAIYSYINNVYKYDELLKKVPSIVKWGLENKNSNTPLNDSTNYNLDFSNDMIQCPAFLSIYWQTVDHGIITKEFVLKNFGEYGVSVLKKMSKEKIIKETIKEIFTTGCERSTPVSAKAASKIAGYFVTKKFSPQKTSLDGENIIGINVVKLDPLQKEILLQKMENLNREIAQLEKISVGVKTHCFTVVCADSMNNGQEIPKMQRRLN